MDQTKDWNERRNLEKYLADYEALPFEEIQEQFRRREIVKKIKDFKFKRLIEIGCGRKSILNDLPLDTRATIIDPIVQFLQLNQELLSSHLNLVFYSGFLKDFIKSNPAKHDLCILSSLLHEVARPEELLQDCWNAITTSGKLIVVVPNVLSIHRILGVQKGITSNLIELTDTQQLMQQLNSAFSTESLAKLISENGFLVQEVYTFLPKLLSHAQMHTNINSGVISVSFVEQLDALSEELDPFGSEIMLIAEKTG